MCGVIGVAAHEPVNQILYDGLTMLQHRVSRRSRYRYFAGWTTLST